MITGEPEMYKQIRNIVKLGALAGALLPLAGPAAAQDEEPAYGENARHCIDLRSVRRTDVIDDRNIMFYVRGDVVYHNILPRQCNGLSREDRFSYKTSMGRLCRLDSIYVLYNDALGLREGNSCQLGLFHEISKEDAEAFRDEASGGPQAKPLPMPEPEAVGGNDEEDDDSDPTEPR